MRLLLALVALALGGVLAWQWADWPPPAPELSDAAAEAAVSSPPEMADPLARLRPLEDKEEYAVVIERPLFSPTRRPPEEEPAEAVPEVAEDASLDRIDLNAVLITEQESLAWVVDSGSREVRRLRLGDEVEGWAVRDILTDRLVLERQGQTNTLVLRDYARQPPPVARPTPPVRAPQRNQPPGQRPQPQAGQPPPNEHAQPPPANPPQ